MTPIEVRGMTPEEMIREIEASVKRYKENKYAYQVGLKDVDFDVNQKLLEIQGQIIPFWSIQEAEQALASRAIQPSNFIEYDGTRHQVLAFDPRPVGYSGFMDCVTHSPALTDLGLFEVGHYPAMNLSSANRTWQWFLHRRLALLKEVSAWQEANQQNANQFLRTVYTALTGLD